MHHANYSVNALNQYTSRDIPGVAEAHRYADTNTWVWVNGIEPLRQWDYFWQEFGVNNLFAGVFTNLETITVDAASTNVFEDVSYVQQSPETFQYDLDGNLIQDGQWHYTWDAENRMVHQENLSVIPEALRLSLSFTHDWQGRRIAKTVSQNGMVTTDRRFYYDGWNLIREVDNITGLRISYTWGLDLSQSRQGAGGVGGLLAISVENGPTAGTYATAYDGNGNIIGLVNTTDRSVAAQYEYGPFGELLSATGPMANLNPFGFSTKYRDAETGLLYYGYRYYNPSTGRWNGRDPLDENGGANLYAFIQNDPFSYADPLGLSLYAFDGTNNDKDRDLPNGENTNVEILWRIYQPHGRERAFYQHGVGTRDGFKNGRGLANGYGFDKRVRDMLDDFEAQIGKGDCVVNVIGFSRGAAEARDFVNRVRDQIRTLQINWLGLFDTVESVGLPASDLAGYRMQVPDTVERAFQIVAADEHRRWFPLTSIRSISGKLDPRYAEVTMRGAHSDIGGGYETDRDLANKALFAMWQDGINHNVPFGPFPIENTFLAGSYVHDSRYWWYDKPLDFLTGRGWLRGPHPRTIIYVNQ